MKVWRDRLELFRGKKAIVSYMRETIICKVGVIFPVILMNSIRAGCDGGKAVSPAEKQQKEGLSC